MREPEMEELRCEHCGQLCEYEWELNIVHRGCRLRALFPDATTKTGSLLKLDMAKVKAAIEKKEEDR